MKRRGGGAIPPSLQQGNIELGMSPSYWKRRREKMLARSRKGVAARERKRMEFDPDREGWKVAGTYLVRVWAAPDGRSVAMDVSGRTQRCGSERAVRGALARAFWGAEGKG